MAGSFPTQAVGTASIAIRATGGSAATRYNGVPADQPGRYVYLRDQDTGDVAPCLARSLRPSSRPDRGDGPCPIRRRPACPDRGRDRAAADARPRRRDGDHEAAGRAVSGGGCAAGSSSSALEASGASTSAWGSWLGPTTAPAWSLASRARPAVAGSCPNPYRARETRRLGRRVDPPSRSRAPLLLARARTPPGAQLRRQRPEAQSLLSGPAGTRGHRNAGSFGGRRRKTPSPRRLASARLPVDRRRRSALRGRRRPTRLRVRSWPSSFASRRAT